MKTISIYNIKGGVSKTTTAINLSSELAAQGNRVLLIDNAPQANATTGIGLHAGETHSILEVMTKKVEIQDAITETDIKNLDLLPSHIRYITGDSKIGAHAIRLLRALEKIKDNYDFCLIDNDPAINILSTNSLVASDYVIIPIRIDKYALDGFGYLLNTIESIQEDYNPNLKILGVLLTQYEKNTTVMSSLKTDLEEKLGDMVFNTVIRKNIKLVESPFYGQPVNVYDRSSYGAKDYLALTEEVLQRVQEK